MGLLDRVINRVVDNVTSQASIAVGRAVGDAVGDIASEAGKSLTNEIKEMNQEKEIELKRNALNAELEMANQRKASNLPPNCPHCGAPTENKLVCEYCDSKIIE